MNAGELCASPPPIPSPPFPPVTINFSELPSPENRNNRVFRCNPLASGQPYFWVESDGTAWRPLNGSAVLYKLQAPVDGTDDAAPQLLIQIPIPPGLLQVGSILRFTLGADHIGGVADSGTVIVRLGKEGDITDGLLHNPSLNTTNISLGSIQEFQVLTNTTIRKHGASSAGTTTSLTTSSSTVRASAVTIDDIATETNILSLFVDLTTGGLGEYYSIHGFVVELVN